MIIKHVFKCSLAQILFLLICICTQATAQVDSIPEPIHEITIYTMPTLMPLNWDNPASLYKSMKKCYFKTILESDNYLLGHVAVRINTPLLPKPLLVAMTSASAKEKTDLILKKKIGFAILGATLQGRLESEQELTRRLEIYTKRNKLAFINFRINEKAAQRLIQFIDRFSKIGADQHAAYNYYGGSFWPGYKDEGSGCSAFGMALLDAINLLPPESEKWLIQVNIPMKIIGGEYNQNKKIKTRTIYKTTEWDKGEGTQNIDYVPYRVYEPSVMFEWILNERNHGNGKYTAIERSGAPGLSIDNRAIQAPINDSIVKIRSKPDIFIERYIQKRAATGSKNNDSK